jgi:hypothetical protein
MIPAVSSAQIKKVAGGAYLMRLKFTKGQTNHLELTESIVGLPPNVGGAGADGKLNVVMQSKSTVQSVTNGNATMLVSIGPTTLNGKTQGATSPLKSVTIDSTGHPVGSAKGQGQGFGAKLPEKPVKVGDSWSAPLPVAGAAGGGGSATFTFKGIKNVDGKQVAVILMSVKNPQIKSGTGTLYLTVADGAVYKGSITLNTVNPQTGSPMTMTVGVHRKS